MDEDKGLKIFWTVAIILFLIVLGMSGDLTEVVFWRLVVAGMFILVIVMVGNYKGESIGQSEPTQKDPVKIKHLFLLGSNWLVETNLLPGCKPERFKKKKLSKLEKSIGHQSNTRANKFVGGWRRVSEKDRLAPSLVIWDDGTFMIREVSDGKEYRGAGSYEVSGERISLAYKDLVFSGLELPDDFDEQFTKLLGK